jgi:hypothetical protein
VQAQHGSNAAAAAASNGSNECKNQSDVKFNSAYWAPHQIGWIALAKMQQL